MMLQIKYKIIEFFGRLSSREKALVGILVLVFFIFVVLVLGLFFHQKITSLQNEIEEGKKSMVVIKRLTPEYITKMAKKKQIESLLLNNKITSLRIPVNDIAKKISLEEEGFGGKITDMDMGFKETKLSDIISFEGKTVETLIETKGKKKKGGPSIFSIEQNMEFRDVPINAVYKFIDGLSKMEDLIYVTKLEIIRKFNNMKNARATITVATYRMRKESLKEEER